MEGQLSAPWTGAKPDQIAAYYRGEFPEYIGQIPDWITPNGPKQYAVALTDRHRVFTGESPDEDEPGYKEFVRRDTRPDSSYSDGFDDWDELTAFFTNPAKHDPVSRSPPGLVSPTEFSEGGEPVTPPRAEAVYFKLDQYDRFWVLAFDIDAKDVALKAVQDGEGDADGRSQKEVLRSNGIYQADPEGYPYRFEDVSQAISYAFDLETWLKKALGINDTQVVYSGQGAHIYGLDDDPAHQYTSRTRRNIIPMIQENLGIPIDGQVTADDQRVMRLPYTLHTDVSRIVTPINSSDYDFRSNPIPDFLLEQRRSE